MSNLIGFKTSISTAIFPFNAEIPKSPPKISAISPSPSSRKPTRTSPIISATKIFASSVSAVPVEEQQVEVEIADGYTMTQFCDKIIDMFLTEKPKAKDWKKYLVFREEWKKYRGRFYTRCQSRADAEVNDPAIKEKYISLARKVKKIDDEMDRHEDLLKEIQDSPRDVNAIVTKRRKDFTGEFFRYLTLLSETYDSLEDRDGN